MTNKTKPTYDENEAVKKLIAEGYTRETCHRDSASNRFTWGRSRRKFEPGIAARPEAEHARLLKRFGLCATVQTVGADA